jgi:hypothetical protein
MPYRVGKGIHLSVRSSFQRFRLDFTETHKKANIEKEKTSKKTGIQRRLGYSVGFSPVFLKTVAKTMKTEKSKL